MAYQALYRKYRSQRFDEMVGQEVVATTLKHAIVNHQISHAYLFSGPRGTGKTSAAKIFAKAINCPNQIDGEPCNNCFICDAITKGTLEDVIELDAASNNGVDEIREIRDKSTYAASQATYKVYIIDEVHMLSTGAFNALLKTLEEPTENVVFVLATTELQKIPATIISRVQRFAFKAITASDIRGHLEQVLADEKIDFDPTALDVIAKSAEGGMRDALSLLDQALSFSDGTLRENDALLVTGSIASQALENYVAALVSADEKSALLELDKIFAEGKNMLRFTEDLLAYFRDLLLKPSDIAHARLFAWIDIAIESLKTIKETTQTKIAADVMTMRLAEVDKNLSALTESSMSGNNNSVSAATATNRFSGVASIDSVGAAVDDRNENALQAEINQLKREIQNLKNQISSGQVSSALTKTSSEEKSAAISHSAPSSSSSNHKVSRDLIYKALGEATREALTAASQAWPELVASITIPAERALLNNTKPAAAGQHYLVVTFPHENLARRVTENADLQLTCGNLLSSIAGFSPEIIALAESDWQEIRRDYVADFKAKKSQEAQDNAEIVTPSSQDSTVENGDAAAMSESEENKPDDSLSVAKQLFGDKVIEIDD